jgi:Tol biopolymer transport system component
MTNADPVIKERLASAVDPLSLDVEARLQRVHHTSHTAANRRYVAALAVGLAAAVLATFVASRLLPRDIRNEPAAGSEPSGLIAYTEVSNDVPEGQAAVADVYSVDVATDTSSPIDVGPSFAFYPVWSPDGSRVAFAKGGSGVSTTYNVVVASSDGSSQRTIVTDTPVISISWSPDGSRLAYIGSEPTGGHSVWTVNADGTGATRVLRGEWEQVAWSPDGATLLLAGFPLSQDSGQYDLFAVGIDGGGLNQLTDTPDFEHFPAWSPDGSRILFVRSPGEDDVDYRSDIFVMNADGSGAARLTDWQGFDSFPVWAPDSRWIAFASDRGATEAQQQDNAKGSFGGISLYVMTPDGSGIRLLVEGGASAALPTSWAG